MAQTPGGLGLLAERKLDSRDRKLEGEGVAFSEDSPEGSCQPCLHSGPGGAARWCGSMDDGRLIR